MEKHNGKHVVFIHSHMHNYLLNFWVLGQLVVLDMGQGVAYKNTHTHTHPTLLPNTDTTDTQLGEKHVYLNICYASAQMIYVLRGIRNTLSNVYY